MSGVKGQVGTSAWLPGAKVLLQRSQRRHGRCQFFPRDDTFSATHTHTHNHFCFFHKRTVVSAWDKNPTDKLASAHRNTRSCCTAGRCWVLRKRTRNLQLNKTLIIRKAIKNTLSGSKPTPDFFFLHLFLFRIFLTLDWSSSGGFLLLLWAPARFHRNGSRGLVDGIVIHVGTGSSDVHTLLRTQKWHSDKNGGGRRTAEEVRRRERHLWAQRGRRSTVCGSRGSRHAAKDKREAKLTGRLWFIYFTNVSIRNRLERFTS